MHYLYMLLTHAVDAPYHSTLSTSPVNTPYQCTLSRHIINNCYQHPTNTCQPITATPLSLPEQQTVFIATCICTSSPTNTPTYPPPSPYQHPAYYQQTESNATCISTSSPLVIPPPFINTLHTTNRPCPALHASPFHPGGGRICRGLLREIPRGGQG